MKNILKKSKKGFTIIELVIVIGVIAILSAIMIPTFVNLTDKANKAALQNDLTATYSTYVSDAADGKVGDPDATGAKDLALYPQAEITIKSGDNYYTRDGDGVWATAEFADVENDLESVVTPAEDYIVGDNIVFHIVQD